MQYMGHTYTKNKISCLLKFNKVFCILCGTPFLGRIKMLFFDVEKEWMGETVNRVFSMRIFEIDLYSWIPDIEKWEQSQPIMLTQYLLNPVQNNPFLRFHVVFLSHSW